MGIAHPECHYHYEYDSEAGSARHVNIGQAGLGRVEAEAARVSVAGAGKIVRCDMIVERELDNLCQRLYDT